MKRNAGASAAPGMSAAALVGSQAISRPESGGRRAQAAQQISPEGQKVAQALSDAFGEVADFVKPSVVQISVEKKVAAGLGSGRRRIPFPLPGPDGEHGNIDPKDLEEMLRR